ncbi:MAG: isochorismatase family protein [Alphaproteobacteria bacterium]
MRACFESPLVEWDKKSFGAMGQDNIRHHVLAQDRRTALIIGLETDVCVLQTAVGLRESGFRSVAVQDAVGAPKPDHLYGLERMAARGIEKAHVKGVKRRPISTPDRRAKRTPFSATRGRGSCVRQLS